MTTIYREITPLTKHDCFTIFSRHKREFDFPLHHHEEFELNFIRHAKGVKRIVGDHTDVIDDIELVLVGTNLPHGWFNHRYHYQEGDEEVLEVTLQFHRDLFDEKLLSRNHLSFIRTLLERSARGILFSRETAEGLEPRLIGLTRKHGFDSMLDLMSILHDLSTSRNMRSLANASFSSEPFSYNSRRIQKAFDYLQNHFNQEITLLDVSKLVGMTEVSFSRFIRKRTGKTFTDSLNEIRLGHASRTLIDTTLTISEVAYRCGFNNLSYFNRLFKAKNGCTPKEFRENFSGTRMFV
ncbi:MAG: AraC family transcriptional regulator [Cytophagaceae bacterium]|nr:AraC family transcriptional regulator [Cytophagaceae bacterium]